MIIASALTIGGAWLRYLSVPTDSFDWVLVGSVVGAFGAPVFHMAPTKVAHAWFPESEANKAAAVATLGYPTGIMLGYGLPAIYMDGGDLSPGHEATGLKHFE